MTTERQVPYAVVTAFSSSPNGGNPAAIVFPDANLSEETCQTIARNLMQPMSVFLWPAPSGDPHAYKVRFFTPSGDQVQLCGHGMVAASQAVAERLQRGESELPNELEFQTKDHGSVHTRRSEDETWELTMPATVAEEVSSGEHKRLTPIFEKALGKPLKIQYIGVGGEGFKQCGS